MDRFINMIFKFRVWIIVVILIATIILGIFIKELKINPDVLSYLPDKDPAVSNAKYINEKYGLTKVGVVLLEYEKPFSKEMLLDLKLLTDECSYISNVTYVLSLFTILDVKGDSSGITIEPLIDGNKIPEDERELRVIYDYLMGKENVKDVLISSDGRYAILLCYFTGDPTEAGIKIKEVVESKEIYGKAYFGGLPFQLLELNKSIFNDVKFLLPLTTIIIVLILSLSFRDFKAVLLIILTTIIATIWTMGIMGILKIKVTIISNIIPVVLIATGNAYGIHIISSFIEKGNEKKEALRSVITTVFLAAFTTMIGFISFVIGAYLKLIREFGIFTTIGIALSFLINITLIPAIISLKGFKKKEIKENNHFDTLFYKFSRWIVRKEKLILIISTIFWIFSILGIPLIERKVDFIDYFGKDSEIRKIDNLISEKFGGSIPIYIIVRGDIKNPDVLNEMKKFEDFLKSTGEIKNTYSVVHLVQDMNEILGFGKNIPDTREKVSNLWFFLEGQEMVKHFVDYEAKEALIQGTIKGIYTKTSSRMISEIEEYIRNIKIEGAEFILSGTPLVYRSLDLSILKSQLVSLVISILFVFITLSILMKSPFGGLIGIIPIVFSIVILLGCMGFLHIPLDVATALVGSVSIGIGIDYSIHFVGRLKKEYEKTKEDVEVLRNTLDTTGKAIVLNVITVTSGFLVLLLGTLTPVKRFGFLIALTMISAGFGSLTILPSIILLTKKFILKNRTKKEDL